jgi:hypothetical protein
MVSPIQYVNPTTGSVIDPVTLSYISYTFPASSSTQLGWPIYGSGTTQPTSPIARIMDIGPATGSGATMVLPDASQRGFGDSLINNHSGNALQINDFTGANVVLLNGGSSAYLYSTAQTQSGTWGIINFGAVVASTNASVLAGAGLIAQGVTLNDAYPVTAVSTAITLAATHRATVQELAPTIGATGWSLTSSATLGNNWFTLIRNAGAGVLTITPLNGGDTIDAAATAVFNPGDSGILICTGTSFITVGRGRNVVFAYTTLTKNSNTSGGNSGFGASGGAAYTEVATDYANLIQFWKGTVTATQTITLPSVPNIFFMSNLTAGGFGIIFTTGAGMTYTLAANNTATILCDGTNIVPAVSVPIGSVSSIILNPGAANNATLAFTTDGVATGLYAPASHQIGVTINSTQTAIFSATNFTSLVPISGGTF